MLLAIDIGNTNILFGIFDNDNLLMKSRIASDRKITAEQYALQLDGIVSLKGAELSKITGAIISSVVPELTSIVKEAVYELTGINALVLGPGVRSGLSIRIDNPAQLGADLVAGAVGAIEKYKMPCLVIDLGTATKISVIDSNGVYRGCTITAGVGISISALSGAAALLPDIDINANVCSAFGTNTVTSMQSGVILGTATMLDGMCEKIEEALGDKVESVVATGGYAENIVKYCKRSVSVELELILYGLNAIYKKN